MKKFAQCIGTFVLSMMCLSVLFQGSMQTYYEQTYAKPWFFERTYLPSIVSFQKMVDKTLGQVSHVFVKAHQQWNESVWFGKQQLTQNVVGELLQNKEVVETSGKSSEGSDQKQLAMSVALMPKKVSKSVVSIPKYGVLNTDGLNMRQLESDVVIWNPELDTPIMKQLKSNTSDISLADLSKWSALLLLKSDEKVFFAGDSLMEGVAPHAIRMLYKDHKIHASSKAKVSTGLSYPGFFNWPKTIKTVLEQDSQIKVVVMLVGANDTNPMIDPEHRGKHIPFDDERWSVKYHQQIREVIDIVQSHGVQLLWLELPNMRRKTLNKRVQVLNQMYKEEMAAHHVRFLSIKSDLGMTGSQYSAYSKGERAYKMRTDDGIHFSYRGQKIVAKKILDQFCFIDEYGDDALEQCAKKLEQ